MFHNSSMKNVQVHINKRNFFSSFTQYKMSSLLINYLRWLTKGRVTRDGQHRCGKHGYMLGKLTYCAAKTVTHKTTLITSLD